LPRNRSEHRIAVYVEIIYVGSLSDLQQQSKSVDEGGTSVRLGVRKVTLSIVTLLYCKFPLQ
jgi:hypothetical protein